ncbi:MAG: hypothetical protein ACE5MI_14265 [Acidimicrobiia bacterium]
MKKRLVASGILLGLGLAACSDGTTEDTTTTTVEETTITTAVQETTTTSAPVVLQVTFDGENCTYEGPSELSAGNIDIVLHNESPGSSTLGLWRLDEGITAQEVADALAENPSAEPTSEIHPTFYRQGLPAGESFEATRHFPPGVHVVTCALIEERITHFGGDFTVTE